MHILWYNLVGSVVPFLAAWLLGISLWWGFAGSVVFHGVLALGMLYPRSSFICPTIWRGPQREERFVALTFDDGPHPVFTERVLEILSSHDVPATFFFIGQYVEAHPQIARQVVEARHELGNHTFTHSRHIYALSKRHVQREIEHTQQAIHRATGIAPRYFRPPVGFRSPVVARVMRETGLTLVNYTFSCRDIMKPTQTIIDRALKNVCPGAILVLHDGSDRNPEQCDRTPLLAALPLIIEQLTRRGCTFVPLSHLLA